MENVEPSRKQHSAPEYLERRRGRRRSTSIIPDFGLLKAQRARRGIIIFNIFWLPFRSQFVFAYYLYINMKATTNIVF